MIAPPIEHCESCVMCRSGRCPFTTERVPKGTVLWRQGEVPKKVTFVRQGLVATSTKEPTGDEAQAGVRGPGALLGTEALLAAPATSTAETLSDARLCTATAEATTAWAGPTSAGFTFVQAMVEEQLRAAKELSLRSGPSLARVARFLLENATLIEGGQRRPFSKQHVARLLAMRAETFSRCLTQLIERGVVSDDERLELKDRPALEAIAAGTE